MFYIVAKVHKKVIKLKVMHRRVLESLKKTQNEQVMHISMSRVKNTKKIILDQLSTHEHHPIHA
jgi:hypothetical protein